MSVQVNVNLDDTDATALDRMAAEDGFDNRSAFVRRLIRQEVIRRYRVVSVSTLPHPPDAEPVPLVMIDPLEAGKQP